MNEPTPIADARTIIASDPVFRAVAGFTSVDILTFLGRGNADTSAEQHANARTIVASRTPDPTTLLRLADEMAGHARTYRTAIAALGFADVPMERVEHEGRRDRALAGMRAAVGGGR